MSFLGFRRSDGSVGVRNYIGIISTVSCANDLSWWIHNQVKGTASFLHQAGCSQMKVDLNDTARTLISVGKNPNLAGVLLVSLGCEGVPVDLVE
jgi:altronate dehydratase large subunit